MNEELIQNLLSAAESLSRSVDRAEEKLKTQKENNAKLQQLVFSRIRRETKRTTGERGGSARGEEETQNEYNGDGDGDKKEGGESERD